MKRTGRRWGIMVSVFFLASILWTDHSTGLWRQQRVLEWDARSYYLYLPGIFIQHDLLDMAHLREYHPDGHITYGEQNTIIHVPSTGHGCNKYTMGTAMSELPFFLPVRAWRRITMPHNTDDGFEPPYQLAVTISSAVWAFLGLLVLSRFLSRWIAEGPAAIALAALAFGTNLFYYASSGAGMSHAFLFFLFAVVLEGTDTWYRTPRWGAALMVGAALGLITLTRPVDALVAFVPLCWQLWSREQRAHTFILFRRHWRQLLAALALGVCLLLPQIAYWSVTTGHLFHYSYGSESFDFASPHVLDGLFSYRKGWFVYTPLALVAWCGVVLMRARTDMRSYAFTMLTFFIPFCYVVFCWWSWSYGGSFGCRALVDTLPLLALPLAVLTREALKAERSVALLFCVMLITGIALNLFQQYQYQLSIIRWDGMTRERYWEVFGHASWEGLSPFDPK